MRRKLRGGHCPGICGKIMKSAIWACRPSHGKVSKSATAWPGAPVEVQVW
jgi:hypothetical protein